MVMLKILQARLQQYVNQELQDVQARFRKGRGTRDQIANICWNIKKAREFQTNIYYCLLTMPKPLTVSDQIRSVAQSCPTLCDLMNRSMPGLPVHHQLPEFTETQVHQCHPAISSSVVPFSTCPQSLPASESFPMS